MADQIKELQKIIDDSNKIVFFGGAGVSTESGIPDFRSQDGLYSQKWKYPPETIISRSFFDSDPKELLNEPAELGLRVKGLFFAEEGFRHFFSTTKIEKVEDFKGLRVRGTSDAAMQGLLNDFGAVSVQVNYADLYDSLQRGVIGAAEQPIANYLGKRFYEVAPYIVLDGHTLGVMEPVITLEAWNSLSDRQQKILLEAGRYASEVCRRFSTSEENRIKRELVKENATITEVTDKEPWQKACERVIKDACAVDSALYEKILSYAPRL